jgi:hypothetical protein
MFPAHWLDFGTPRYLKDMKVKETFRRWFEFFQPTWCPLKQVREPRTGYDPETGANKY